jgi:plasmid replication initiation protein
MSSVYAIRLYELLVQWRELGEREVQIAWLKEQFQVPNNYSRMYDFKKNVIDIAVDQINTYSDLTVSYTQRKAGRQVVALQFKFGPKADKQPRQATAVPASKPRVDRAYIEANARPGESWAEASARLSARATE